MKLEPYFIFISFFISALLSFVKYTNLASFINSSSNDLILSLNGGQLDKNFRVNWQDYRNCILLTTSSELKKLDTKVHEIINF